MVRRKRSTLRRQGSRNGWLEELSMEKTEKEKWSIGAQPLRSGSRCATKRNTN